MEDGYGQGGGGATRNAEWGRREIGGLLREPGEKRRMRKDGGRARLAASDRNFCQACSSGEDFEAQVINDTTGPAWVAMLYANWCGHCHHYAPLFIKYAEAFEKDPRVKFAACDCAQYNEFCTSLGVKSYPTLRGFRFVRQGDRERKSPAEIARVGEEVPRDVQPWVHAHLPSRSVGTSGIDGRARPPTNLRDRFVKGRTTPSSTRSQSAASPDIRRVDFFVARAPRLLDLFRRTSFSSQVVS